MCTLKNNTAATYGGALYCGDGSSAMVSYCTFINNTAGSLGSGIYSTLGSQPIIEYSIVAFNAGNMGVYASLPGDAPSLMCCDIYGNTGGDWVGNIADQDTAYGNFSADPLFCDTTGTELRVELCSPCLAGYHPRGHDCSEVIGRWDGDCGCGEATEPMTWGAVKALYR
jgi:predicted outer membrane repeat protein